MPSLQKIELDVRSYIWSNVDHRSATEMSTGQGELVVLSCSEGQAIFSNFFLPCTKSVQLIAEHRPGQDQSDCPVVQFCCSKFEVFSMVVSVFEVFAEVSTGRQHVDDKEYKMRQTTGSVPMFSSLTEALNSYFICPVLPLISGQHRISKIVLRCRSEQDSFLLSCAHLCSPRDYV